MLGFDKGAYLGLDGDKVCMGFRIDNFWKNLFATDGVLDMKRYRELLSVKKKAVVEE